MTLDGIGAEQRGHRTRSRTALAFVYASHQVPDISRDDAGGAPLESHPKGVPKFKNR